MLFNSSTVKIVGRSHKSGTTISKSKAPFFPANCNKGSRPYGPPETLKKIMATSESSFSVLGDDVFALNKNELVIYKNRKI
jgi:hypothetical protein